MQPPWRRWLKPSEAVDDGRWVVLDVEASGLDAARELASQRRWLAPRP